MSDLLQHEEILVRYDSEQHNIRTFMDGVFGFIGQHPDLNLPAHAAVHSYKSRLKDREHLRAKIGRKIAAGREITAENFFHEITDLAGVRILHLFQDDFRKIDEVIRSRVREEYWFFGEQPKAYTWDPEAADFFRGFDLEVVQKPTSYTSVHYLIRPKPNSPICCEVQVRTLFEEIWGEVDHQINYPQPTESIACREQIKVLSKIVGAGSRLLDALRRVHHAGQ